MIFLSDICAKQFLFTIIINLLYFPNVLNNLYLIKSKVIDGHESKPAMCDLPIVQ